MGAAPPPEPEQSRPARWCRHKSHHWPGRRYYSIGRGPRRRYNRTGRTHHCQIQRKRGPGDISWSITWLAPPCHKVNHRKRGIILSIILSRPHWLTARRTVTPPDELSLVLWDWLLWETLTLHLRGPDQNSHGSRRHLSHNASPLHYLCQTEP